MITTDRVVAIVQARMGSSRLPNKMMLWLHGLPVAGWVLHRVRQAKLIQQVVFALPDTPHNDVLTDYLQSEGATVFRGSEGDVLGRTLSAAQAFNADWVVRVCADNPLIAGTEIDRLVAFYSSRDYDYAYNHMPINNRYPNGLGAEIATLEVLAIMDREARMPDQREHVFNYLWANQQLYSIGTFSPDDPVLAHPELKLDLDTISDYHRLLNLRLHPNSSTREVVTKALSFTASSP